MKRIKINIVRQIVVILLILTAFFSLVLLGSSHANITMKNKETSQIVYASIVFVLTSGINMISLKKTFNYIVVFSSVILNLITGIILIFTLVYLVRTLWMDLASIFFTIINVIEVILIFIIVRFDLKNLMTKWV